ncbi:MULTISPECIES: GNAT family N-acetyltransferase [Streptosporangium]|uniref:GNAT superfamily N-acetyltransferase n=1 Tax=Streptosporangium brasiliense TaxID=47480 RepID=A0ABT9RKJ9_9ACTN|nr:GNAT family N-acetyltransferase [Streptosporangium brasiliense]MDP9869833.1 GNAT superfamily N-acetyltransferase [Streptosporangium brasiliense]
MDISSRAQAYLHAYDAQLRGRPVPGRTVERVGPVLRIVSDGHGQGSLTYRDLGGLEGAELDAFIAAQRDFFTEIGRPVEWKYHGYDLPADLPVRLAAAGFEPEERETVMVGEAAGLATVPVPPEGVRLREAAGRADLERIREMEEAVWEADRGWLPDLLERDMAGPGDRCAVVLAEAGEQVVCAAWMRFHEGTDFVSLWGGSTLKEWRGRGVYRAMVAHRAGLAVARGFRLVQVDASEDSRPILARLGLAAVATTTPYVWVPPTA